MQALSRSKLVPLVSPMETLGREGTSGCVIVWGGGGGNNHSAKGNPGFLPVRGPWMTSLVLCRKRSGVSDAHCPRETTGLIISANGELYVRLTAA